MMNIMREKFRFLFLLWMTTGGMLASGQNYNEILGRPEGTSITMSILFDQKADVYWEYGTSTGIYTMSTPTYTTLTDTALQAAFTNLLPDKKYFYRTRYRLAGTSGDFLAGTEHIFHTLRPHGSSFTFAIEADPHMDTNSLPASYSLTLQNILLKNPDFLIDLGDIFMSEKLQVKNQANITARHLLYRPYFGATCHSVPLFLVIGNHEGENGWSIDGTANSLPVLTANTRKLFYPNPLPDAFYSGDSIPEPFVGLMGNYYSWEWGDALFIVLDPYWYTTSHSEWGWTLGTAQYNWFSRVISRSNAKFKFVFCHQLVGGSTSDGRGGSEFAGYYENGGMNTDGSWGFDVNRPGWQKTVHELMVENHVNIFFHGHDHCYAKQDLDGIVYQEVPQPSARNITNITGTQYGYVNGTLLPSRGFLLVTVTDSTAKVDYVKTYLPNEETGNKKNGQVADSYTLGRSPSGISEQNGSTENSGPGQNYPNPFSSGTTLPYKLNTACKVSLVIYSTLGNELATLVNKYQQPGDYSVKINTSELHLNGGIYYCRLTAGNESKSIKMICIR
jgi:Calcineurin-like phosphoesterase/Secretion system C-terminal sorting domain